MPFDEVRDVDSAMTNTIDGVGRPDWRSGDVGPLLVVGAARGIGRWLGEQLLAQQQWLTVTLVDTDGSASPLAEVAATFNGDVICAVVASDPAITSSDRLVSVDDIDISAADTKVILAVPQDALAATCRWMRGRLSDSASIGVVTPTFASTLGDVAGWLGRSTVFGVHPLLDMSVHSVEGQTVLVVPGDQCEPDAYAWLSLLVVNSGGICRTIGADEHDRFMSYVQVMTHQALFAFIQGIVRSGLDLNLLWEFRTPLFEALFGLTARVLTQKRQSVTARIQTSFDGTLIAAQLRMAVEHVALAVDSRSPEAIETLIQDARATFSGTLFETVQATAETALAAAQSKRAELARRRRTGSLVGLRQIGRSDSLRVGKIRDVTPVSVTLEELMVGRAGEAILLDGNARNNAVRVGIVGQARDTVFALGHVELVLGDELEEAFDMWLAHIRRDIRFLVPESVAGAGVLGVVAGRRGIRDASLVSEVVRTGQRSVVVRIGIRADHDVDEMVEGLRALVDHTYGWPRGLSRPVRQRHRLHYLGPSGTFSEAAAGQAAESVGISDPTLIPSDDFDSVLTGTTLGDLAVLPISSSASGLVQRAAKALLDHVGELEIGGVVDVAVRFDAYVRTPSTLSELRGAPVYSHPQALAQCHQFIARWGLDPVVCSSTAEALHIVSSIDVGAVALAGAGKGADFGLRVIEREVDDLSGSITRFVILGGGPVFDKLLGGSDPTLRSVWIAPSITAIASYLVAAGGTFDEFLTAADGTCLWVTSRTAADVATAEGVRYLGLAPWSPRTPVVRANSASRT